MVCAATEKTPHRQTVAAREYVQVLRNALPAIPAPTTSAWYAALPILQTRYAAMEKIRHPETAAAQESACSVRIVLKTRHAQMRYALRVRYQTQWTTYAATEKTPTERIVTSPYAQLRQIWSCAAPCLVVDGTMRVRHADSAIRYRKMTARAAWENRVCLTTARHPAFVTMMGSAKYGQGSHRNHAPATARVITTASVTPTKHATGAMQTVR